MNDQTDLVDSDSVLVKPASLSVDQGLDPDRARHMIRTAQLLYTFWNTGDTAFLEQSNDPDFRDNTLPPGRPQGIEGPSSASAQFRAAVPDLTCELADLLVVADKFTARLRFRGTFSGIYNGVAGKGQEIDFIAFDIQHVGEEKIVEDWHLEDNLTFLTQCGLVTIAGT